MSGQASELWAADSGRSYSDPSHGHGRLSGQDTRADIFRNLRGVPEHSSLVSSGGVDGQHRDYQGDQHGDVGHLTMTRMTNHETETDNALATSNR